MIGVSPLLLAHGHFHVAGETEVRLPGSTHETTIWSLSANQDPGSVRLLDLATLTDASQMDSRSSRVPLFVAITPGHDDGASPMRTWR